MTLLVVPLLATKKKTTSTPRADVEAGTVATAVTPRDGVTGQGRIGGLTYVASDLVPCQRRKLGPNISCDKAD